MTEPMREHILSVFEHSLGPKNRKFTVHAPHKPIPDGEDVAIAIFPATTWNDLVSTYTKAKGIEP